MVCQRKKTTATLAEREKTYIIINIDDVTSSMSCCNFSLGEIADTGYSKTCFQSNTTRVCNDESLSRIKINLHSFGNKIRRNFSYHPPEAPKNFNDGRRNLAAGKN